MDWSLLAAIALGAVAGAMVLSVARRWLVYRTLAAAQALERQGRLDEALDLLRVFHLTRRGQFTSDLLLRMADLSYQLGRYRESIDSARAALGTRVSIAGYLMAKRIIRDCFLCIGMPDVADAEQRETAEFLEHTGDRGGLASEWRARRFYEQDDLRRTIIELRRSIDRAEGAPKAVILARKLQLAAAYAAAGRFDEAATTANHVLAQRPSLSGAAAAHTVLARVHAARDWLDNAADHAREALAIAERSGDMRELASGYRTRAFVAVCRSEFGPAIAAAETAIGILDPSPVPGSVSETGPRAAEASEARLFLAEIRRLQGDLDQAVTGIKEWLSGPAAPNPLADRLIRSAAHLSLARCHAMAERWEEAQAALAAIPAAPGAVVARQVALTRAEVYAALGKGEDAERELEEARRLYGELPDIPVFRTERWVGEAAVKMRLGAFDEAVDLLQGALGAPAPRRELARIHYCLGLSHRAAGRWEKAEEEFRAACAAPPSAYGALAAVLAHPPDR
jgi:tetratricopeptide (TPR) repeat protein